jgi:hypothetical protein
LGIVNIINVDMIESFLFSNGVISKGNNIPCDVNITELLCITFNIMAKVFFCGHKSGSLSAWVPDDTNFLKMQETIKIHDGV